MECLSRQRLKIDVQEGGAGAVREGAERHTGFDHKLLLGVVIL